MDVSSLSQTMMKMMRYIYRQFLNAGTHTHERLFENERDPYTTNPDSFGRLSFFEWRVRYVTVLYQLMELKLFKLAHLI